MGIDVIRLDEDELTSLLVMSAVKRLLSRGHSAETGHALGDRVNDLVKERIDSVREKCAHDLFLLRGNGAPDDSLRLSAMATFALSGVEIADQVHREAVSLN